MSSDTLTIGSALRRAENLEAHADVLIEGQWLLGRVERVEGDSAVLVDGDGAEVVLRLSSISAVRVLTSLPPARAAAGAHAAPVTGTALDSVLAQRRT